ncbi:MAG: GTPase ObgE [Bacteroidota bacterium]
MFIDSAKIFVRSGKGGNGVIHWRREKFIPKGGPDGGDGGRGGDIIIEVNRQLTTLLDFRYKRRYVAKDGNPGEGSNCEGRSAKHTLIKVPCGTILRDALTKELIVDLTEDKQQFIILKGGRGGKGNTNFATSSNQAPRYCTPGEEGLEKNLELELKLLADVALVGFPNVGKSTLIASISAAKPKIANYPFTTLAPNLGMVYFKEHKSFVVADIPGLIEGAHEGKGLGIQFLRHIERTKVLAFMIESTSENPINDFEILQNELFTYNKDLLTRKKIIVFTKCDLLTEKELNKLKKIKIGKLIKKNFISSATRFGLDELVIKFWESISK